MTNREAELKAEVRILEDIIGRYETEMNRLVTALRERGISSVEVRAMLEGKDPEEARLREEAYVKSLARKAYE